MADRPHTVILWVHPRSTSTMFECALLQRQDYFRVLHEPLGDAWYFSNERLSDRYSSEKCKSDYAHLEEATFKKIWDDITQPGGKRTFSKDMAQYIFPTSSSPSNAVQSFASSTQQSDGNPTVIPTELLLDPSISHSFLIRTPEKAIPSYHRLCYPGSATGFEYFDPSEAGYRELRLLHDFLRAQGRTPLVLESDDLLREPERVMASWCAYAGIDYDDGMLTWDEGTREHFKKWPGFHTSAENSQGINRGLKEGHCTPGNHSPAEAPTPQGSPKKADAKAKDAQPEIVRECIRACMPDYEYLSQFVTRPST